MSAISSVMIFFAPLPTDMINITDEIPMIIPSIVNSERILFALILATAIFKYSKNCDIPASYFFSAAFIPSSIVVSIVVTTVSPSFRPLMISTFCLEEIPVLTYFF